MKKTLFALGLALALALAPALVWSQDMITMVFVDSKMRTATEGGRFDVFCFYIMPKIPNTGFASWHIIPENDGIPCVVTELGNIPEEIPAEGVHFLTFTRVAFTHKAILMPDRETLKIIGSDGSNRVFKLVKNEFW